MARALNGETYIVVEEFGRSELAKPFLGNLLRADTTERYEGVARPLVFLIGMPRRYLPPSENAEIEAADDGDGKSRLRTLPDQFTDADV